MTDRLHSQIELTGQTAILYLFGALGPADVARLCDECASLPATIRTLRIDLNALGHVGADTMDATRSLLRHWRASRRGHLRLSFSAPNLFATLSGDDGEAGRVRGAMSLPRTTDAMTARYL